MYVGSGRAKEVSASRFSSYGRFERKRGVPDAAFMIPERLAWRPMTHVFSLLNAVWPYKREKKGRNKNKLVDVAGQGNVTFQDVSLFFSAWQLELKPF